MQPAMCQVFPSVYGSHGLGIRLPTAVVSSSRKKDEVPGKIESLNVVIDLKESPNANPWQWADMEWKCLAAPAIVVGSQDASELAIFLPSFPISRTCPSPRFLLECFEKSIGLVLGLCQP